MVHRREVNGEPIALGNHGALWGNAMTWWDHGTGSIWSQPLGEAIAGPLKGTTLELLPSTLTTWGDWKDLRPATVALDAPSSSSRFELDVMSIVVELEDESIAYPVPTLRSGSGLANSEVAGVPLAVVIEPGTDNWAVLSRQVGDKVVEFDLRDGVLVERDGPGRWEPIRGLPLEGSDQILDRLPGFTSFDSDYANFFPRGAFWISDGRLVLVDDRGPHELNE
jgi:hypothetical protein